MERFKPEKGQKYWYLSSVEAGFWETTWHDDGPDNNRYAVGNCFATKEQAEAYRDILMRIASARSIVVDVPEGFEVSRIDTMSSTQAKIIYFQPTPPPPPKEVTVKMKVYDRFSHGEPDFDRAHYYMSYQEYVYIDETKEL